MARYLLMTAQQVSPANQMRTMLRVLEDCDSVMPICDEILAAVILSAMIMAMEFYCLYLIALASVNQPRRDCSSFFGEMFLRDSVPNAQALLHHSSCPLDWLHLTHRLATGIIFCVFFFWLDENIKFSKEDHFV